MGWRGKLALLGFLLLSSPRLFADAPPAGLTPDSLRVNQLGDDCFEARQAASRALVLRGLAAQDALLAADKHPDPEVRRRARQILVTIRDYDYRARLSAFEADPQGREMHQLPGWERFRSTIGEGAADRKLFVQMHRQEPAIMTVCDSDFPQLARLLQKRTQDLQSLLYTGEDQDLTLGTAAVFYFVASDPRVPVSEIASSQICNLFNYRPAVQQAMNAGEFGPTVRKLLGAWVARDVEPMVANQHFVMALQYGLKEALEPALRIVKSTGGDAQVRQYALHVVGRFGTKDHVPVLAPLLEDKTVCMTFEVKPGQTSEVQLRDIALGFMVHLSGQAPSEYGYAQSQRNGQWVFMPGTLRFNDGAARDGAFKKWASRTAAAAPAK